MNCEFKGREKVFDFCCLYFECRMTFFGSRIKERDVTHTEKILRLLEGS